MQTTRTPGLNPFYFRVFLKEKFTTITAKQVVSIPFISGFSLKFDFLPASRETFVSIPFISGFSLNTQERVHGGDGRCLNPFYFRVFLKPADGYHADYANTRGLNPFYFRVFLKCRDYWATKALMSQSLLFQGFP